MRKKILTVLTILLSANFTLANAATVNSDFSSVTLNQLHQEELKFAFSAPVMVRLKGLEGDYTFNVNPTTSGNESDTITVFCDKGILKLKAGETGGCKLAKNKSFLGVTVKDFKNGSSGTFNQS